jgi:hypothetical protein
LVRKVRTFALLSVTEPLPHYSYSIAWRPMEHADALEVRPTA